MRGFLVLISILLAVDSNATKCLNDWDCRIDKKCVGSSPKSDPELVNKTGKCLKKKKVKQNNPVGDFPLIINKDAIPA